MYGIRIRENDINRGNLMELLYKIKDRVQQESIDYIEENRSSVVKNNQKTLFALNIIYFVVGTNKSTHTATKISPNFPNVVPKAAWPKAPESMPS